MHSADVVDSARLRMPPACLRWRVVFDGLVARSSGHLHRDLGMVRFNYDVADCHEEVAWQARHPAPNRVAQETNKS
jgi:hypothetical protein